MFFRNSFENIYNKILMKRQNIFEDDGYITFNNEKNILNWNNENYSLWLDSLNIYEKESLRNYAGNEHNFLNSYLRGLEGSNNYKEKRINSLDRGLSKSILPNNIIVMRWDSYSNIIKSLISSSRIKKNAWLSCKAYLSTTLLYGNKIKYSKCEEDQQILLVIKLDKGINAAPIFNISENIHEFELLIDRDCVLEIQKILYKKKRNYIILCKHIPKEKY